MIVKNSLYMSITSAPASNLKWGRQEKSLKCRPPWLGDEENFGIPDALKQYLVYFQILITQ